MTFESKIERFYMRRSNSANKYFLLRFTFMIIVHGIVCKIMCAINLFQLFLELSSFSDFCKRYVCAVVIVDLGALLKLKQRKKFVIYNDDCDKCVPK